MAQKSDQFLPNLATPRLKMVQAGYRERKLERATGRKPAGKRLQGTTSEQKWMHEGNKLKTVSVCVCVCATKEEKNTKKKTKKKIDTNCELLVSKL